MNSKQNMKIQFYSRIHIFKKYLCYVYSENQNWSTYNIVDNTVVGIVILNCVDLKGVISDDFTFCMSTLSRFTVA